MSTCPTCGGSFEKEHGMRVHHYQTHNESIAKQPTDCAICGEVFEYYPKNKEGIICPECVSNGKQGQYLSEKISEKLSEIVSIKCPQCGKEEDVPKSDSYRTFCSKECVNKDKSERMTGKNNPRFVDGESSGSDYDREWRAVRDKVLKRDGKQCVVCGDNEKLHVHHIIPVRSFDEEGNAHYLENAVSLCPSCHRNVEYGNIKIPDNIVEECNLEEPDPERFNYLQ